MEDAGGAKSEEAAFFELFVPGRLCLFGEHSDWAGAHRRDNAGIRPGRTLVAGTQQGLFARCRRLKENVLKLTSVREDGTLEGPFEVPLHPHALLSVAQAGGFWSYGCGTAYHLLTNHRVGGLEVHNYRTTLPLRKGLSSSAAFCVLIAKAFGLCYGLHLTTRGEMEYAYQGEITTPSRCGRMDQACAYGSTMVTMTYDADLLHVERLRVAADLHLVLVDLCAAKCTTTILRELQRGFPHPADDVQRGVHELLGATNERVVAQAEAALAAGDLETLGALMTHAQDRFDALAGPACPEELVAPVLHRTLAHAALHPHIHGAKGVGSQGDGTAQFLCKSAADAEAVCEIIERELSMKPLRLTIAANFEHVGEVPESPHNPGPVGVGPFANGGGAPGDEPYHPDVSNDSASKVEALQAEVARLRAELAAAR
eukprot:PRCOL_00006196-RA